MSKIKLKRGDDEEYQVNVVQSDSGEESPFDLSQVERVDLHAKVNGKLVLSLSTTDGSIEFINRTSGVLLLNFSHQLTENAEWQTAEYDLQLIDRNDKRKTPLSGRIELSHDITQVSQ
ncbi:hypothetical protein ACWIVU_00585 [Ursidibacter arcticus]